MAVLGLVVLSPVIVMLAVLIRSTSPGRALFVQERVGRFEKPFRCYKFRTMAVGAPVASSHEVPGSWITPLGHRLRRYKLDELPQLVNVVFGHMSLVGPRPCLPSQTDVIAARRTQRVFAARPGITGAAQIAGIDMSEPQKLAEADGRYARTQSLAGDLAILLATLGGLWNHTQTPMDRR